MQQLTSCHQLTFPSEGGEDNFDGPGTAVDEVTVHKQTVFLARFPSELEEVEHVVKLTCEAVSQERGIERAGRGSTVYVANDIAVYAFF